MSRAVFLDTSAWIAAAVRNQTGHEAAREAYRAAVRQGARIVTTAMVLGEAQVLFMRLLGREAAAAAVESVLRDPAHEIVAVDRKLVRAAVERWLGPYRDQNFSLCDAVSFEVMRNERINRALAIDHHFAVAGFEIVSAPRL